jgi:hypothetical protein
MSVNTAVYNYTPFAAETFVIAGKDGQEVLILVVSAAFHGSGGATLSLAEEQPVIRASDEHFGDPATSSVRYEADVAPEKPRVDVLVNGVAFAAEGRPTREVVVQIEVGDVRKELVVVGDRRWRRTAWGLEPSEPKPFVIMPIVYERAFGGTDRRNADPAKHTCDVRNPVGVGFQGVRSADFSVESDVPNVEYPTQRVHSSSDHPLPASLGAVGRGWDPRVRLAGTYDTRWLQEHWPLLPEDFNPLHNQCAPADQRSMTLHGGEQVCVRNMTPEGLWAFRLPRFDVPVHCYFDNRHVVASLRFDTVLLEPAEKRISVTFRLAITTQRNRGTLREIVLGHMSRGWLLAHELRRQYFAFGGGGGVRVDVPLYHL